MAHSDTQFLKGYFFLQIPVPEKKHKTGSASPLLANQTDTAFTSNLPAESQCVSLAEGCNLKKHLQGGSGLQPRDAL